MKERSVIFDSGKATLMKPLWLMIISTLLLVGCTKPDYEYLGKIKDFRFIAGAFNSPDHYEITLDSGFKFLIRGYPDEWIETGRRVYKDKNACFSRRYSFVKE